MRRILTTGALCLGLMSASACSNAQAIHRGAYIAGSVSKQYITEAHGIYSEQLNARVTECDPDGNAEIKTEDDFNNCLGQFRFNDKVVLALEVYQAAAVVLFNVLKNPDSPKEAILSSKDDLLRAAESLLNLMPDADKKLNQLKSLIRR